MFISYFIKIIIKLLNIIEYYISKYYYAEYIDINSKNEFNGIMINKNSKNCIIICNGGGYLLGTCYLYKNYIEYLFQNKEKINNKKTIINLEKAYKYLSSHYNNISLYGESAGAHLILYFLKNNINKFKNPPYKIILYSPWFGNINDNYSSIFKLLINKVINISNVKDISHYNWNEINNLDILFIYSSNEFLKNDIKKFLSKMNIKNILVFNTCIHCPTIVTYKLNMIHYNNYVIELKNTIYNFMLNKTHN